MRDYNECRCYVDHLIAEHKRLHRPASGRPQRHHAGG
jgi:hypothetical protein